MGLEGKILRGKSIDGEWVRKHEADEINYSKDSYDYLMDDKSTDRVVDYDDAAVLAAVGLEADGIRKEREESEQLWDSSDLGKYTINTPTVDKLQEEQQYHRMEPISKKEFQEIAGEIDPIDDAIQRECEAAAEELEGLF